MRRHESVQLAFLRAEPSRAEPSLRAWLEYVAQQAIDMLDALDAADEDREDDEIEGGP